MIKIMLSELLKKNKMSQVELARLTSVRKATINELYWNVSEYVKLDTIDSICKALNCDISELIVIESEDKTKNTHSIK